MKTYELEKLPLFTAAGFIFKLNDYIVNKWFNQFRLLSLILSAIHAALQLLG
jgi:hypothetical protein